MLQGQPFGLQWQVEKRLERWMHNVRGTAKQHVVAHTTQLNNWPVERDTHKGIVVPAVPSATLRDLGRGFIVPEVYQLPAAKRTAPGPSGPRSGLAVSDIPARRMCDDVDASLCV
jgi:hypothetical protein